MAAVKFFSKTSAQALETAINTFLGDDYSLINVDYIPNGQFYQAMVGYTEVAETTEDTTPAADAET